MQVDGERLFTNKGPVMVKECKQIQNSLGVKFYGNRIFYIRGQHDVLKVKVICESF